MNKKQRNLSIGLFIIYFLFLIWIILFKLQFSFAYLDHIRNINLIPFSGSVIVNGKVDFLEIIDNVLAFVPYGIFICMLKSQSSFTIKVIPIFMTSLLFEILQFIFAIGASDITDLIANTLGGIIGIGIFFVMSKIFKEKAYKIVNIITLIAAIMLISLVVVLIVANL